MYDDIISRLREVPGMVAEDAIAEITRLRAASPVEAAPAPETKTLRDEFASDWMKGVLANPNQSDSDSESSARMAYRMADAMMKARITCNLGGKL